MGFPFLLFGRDGEPAPMRGADKYKLAEVGRPAG